MASVPFMKPPEPEFTFDVGDMVEVYCDHEKNGARHPGLVERNCRSGGPQDGSRSVPHQRLFDGWVDGA